MNFQFSTPPHILQFPFLFPGVIDVRVVLGMWFVVSYTHVAPWGVFIKAFSEIGDVYRWLRKAALIGS